MRVGGLENPDESSDEVSPIQSGIEIWIGNEHVRDA